MGLPSSSPVLFNCMISQSPGAINLYKPGGCGGVIVNAAKSGRDEWASGDAYEPYVGRWSRLVARVFINWLSVPAKGSWLDIGCGTGALSQTILELADPAHIRGVDRSQGISILRADNSKIRVLYSRVGDAQSLPVASDTYNAVVSGLALNFIPQPASMAAEMRRTVRPGGTVAGCTSGIMPGKCSSFGIFGMPRPALDPAARQAG